MKRSHAGLISPKFGFNSRPRNQPLRGPRLGEMINEYYHYRRFSKVLLKLGIAKLNDELWLGQWCITRGYRCP